MDIALLPCMETVATIGAVTCCPINNGPKSASEGNERSYGAR